MDRYELKARLNEGNIRAVVRLCIDKYESVAEYNNKFNTIFRRLYERIKESEKEDSDFIAFTLKKEPENYNEITLNSVYSSNIEMKTYFFNFEKYRFREEWKFKICEFIANIKKELSNEFSEEKFSIKIKFTNIDFFYT
jgi:hypothetical protein